MEKRKRANYYEIENEELENKYFKLVKKLENLKRNLENERRKVAELEERNQQINSILTHREVKKKLFRFKRKKSREIWTNKIELWHGQLEKLKGLKMKWEIMTMGWIQNNGIDFYYNNLI